MKVLLLGSGGREHALARALNTETGLKLFIAPGNPGTASLGENRCVDPCDGPAVVALAREIEADLVVIGPEAPLMAGVADVLREAGFPVFGPNAAAAALEGSKAFAKEIMVAANVPTAHAVACWDRETALAALTDFGSPYVVKQNGLAAGKGVVVTRDMDEALAHVDACLKASNGDEPALIIEEYLDGPEVSLFCLSDGQNVLPLPAAQDFKRHGEGNTGPNTGGMGSYCPLDWTPKDLEKEVLETVARPVIAQMALRGTPFIGLLYCGLALTSNGLKVVEFNARFGDPETQSILPRLRSSLAEALLAAATGKLAQIPPLKLSEQACVNIVLAAPGYPANAQTGTPITGITAAQSLEGVHVIQAGTKEVDGQLVSSGGRVLSVVALGPDLQTARARAYAGLERIELAGGYYRRDIAAPENLPAKMGPRPQ